MEAGVVRNNADETGATRLMRGGGKRSTGEAGNMPTPHTSRSGRESDGSSGEVTKFRPPRLRGWERRAGASNGGGGGLAEVRVAQGDELCGWAQVDRL